MKKSKIILLLAAVGSVFYGIKIIRKSTHLYDDDRVCYGQIGGPCSEFRSFLDTAILGRRRIIFLGTLTTVGTIPVNWVFRINRHEGDASSSLETLKFGPLVRTRTSKEFGTFSSSVTVNDSEATMKVQGGFDSVHSIIKMRRLY